MPASENTDLIKCNALNHAGEAVQTALAIAWTESILKAAATFREENSLPSDWTPPVWIPGAAHLILPQIR